MKIIAAILFTIAASVSYAEDFYNLEEGATLVYDYHNVLSYSGGENSMSNETNGRMISKVIGSTEIGGKTYAVIETSYENIFGVPPQKGYLRQDDSGVYIGLEIAGEFHESPIVKYPIEVGNSWDYFDGEKGTRRIVEVGTMQLGDRTFDNCIKIERTFGDAEKDSLWTHTAYYVKGIGEVRMYMKRAMGPTLTETTTTIADP
jgi:hypothetical protein